MKFFHVFLVFGALTLGACASSQQERAQSFHDWVNHRHDNVGKREVIINRLDDPPTCWSLTQPKARTDVIVVEPVDCKAHETVLREP